MVMFKVYFRGGPLDGEVLTMSRPPQDGEDYYTVIGARRYWYRFSWGKHRYLFIGEDSAIHSH